MGTLEQQRRCVGSVECQVGWEMTGRSRDVVRGAGTTKNEVSQIPTRGLMQWPRGARWRQQCVRCEKQQVIDRKQLKNGARTTADESRTEGFPPRQKAEKR